MTTEREAPTMEDAKRAAAAIQAEMGEELSQVLLYGSVANGTAHERSDLDLVVLFCDLDYATRYEKKSCLEKVVRETTGFGCDVNVTDLTEWVGRQKVSSAFEAGIAKDAVVVLSNTPGEVKRDKPMVRPMNNEQEATSYAELLEWRVSNLLNNFNRRRYDLQYDDEDSDSEGSVEENRSYRLRSVCWTAGLIVEIVLKVFITLHGVRPARNKDSMHWEYTIDEFLGQLPDPLSGRLRAVIEDCGVEPWDLSLMRWQYDEFYGIDDTYFGGISPTEYAASYADTYAWLALRMAWTAYETVKDIPPYKPNGAGFLQLLREELEITSEQYQTADIADKANLVKKRNQRPQALPIAALLPSLSGAT